MGLPPRPLLWRKCRRHPIVAVLPVQEEKSTRHDSDHLGLDSIQEYGPSHQGRIRTVPPLPKVMAEHNHWALCFVLFLRERSSHGRLNAQNVKKVRCHLSPGKLLRLPVPCQAGRRISRGRHIREHLVLCLPVHIVRRRWRIQCKTDKRSVLPHHHQPARVGIRQRPQQNRVYRAENSRVGADPQRQCRYRDDEKSWFLGDLPQRVPQVCKEVHALETMGCTKCFLQFCPSFCPGGLPCWLSTRRPQDPFKILDGATF